VDDERRDAQVKSRCCGQETERVVAGKEEVLGDFFLGITFDLYEESG
jgi:hypothetical protein